MNINLTLIGQSISFLFFVAFCMKFVWPAITTAMAERQKLIADGLEAADRASRDLELAQQSATTQMAEAKHEAAAIVEQANKRASKIIEDAEVKAQEKAAGILAAADANVEQEVNRAKEQLRSQVATLAIVGAEKILESSVDAAAHKAMLDNLASEL